MNYDLLGKLSRRSLFFSPLLSEPHFAVPFISNFAIGLFNEKKMDKIKDKRIITRFDNKHLGSFELRALKKLLDLGFKLQYDNSIHLKLYINDNDVYVTSSNFTEKGLEKNIELSVKIDAKNVQKCIDLFDKIWNGCSNNVVSYDLIHKNWMIYQFLRKKMKNNTGKPKLKKTKTLKIDEYDLQNIIDEIFRQRKDYSSIDEIVYNSNKQKGELIEKLKQGFNTLIFYAPENHAVRRGNLFYDFVYGYESQLAGTGLREKQFQAVFENTEFESVINYIYPEMIGMKPWNLNDNNEFNEFCNGIFDFDIPQYSEVLPIRIASYFYPDYFVPIFKLDHLKTICEALGLETDAETHGDKLFVYNLFLAEKTKVLPFNNSIKSRILYRLLFTVELYNRLMNGELYENILENYKKKWKKDAIEMGKEILKTLNIIT